MTVELKDRRALEQSVWQQINELQSKLDAVTARNTALHASQAEAWQQQANTQSELQELATQHRQAQASKAASWQQNADLQAELDQMTAQFEELRASEHSALQQHTSLLAELDAATAECRKLQANEGLVMQRHALLEQQLLECGAREGGCTRCAGLIHSMKAALQSQVEEVCAGEYGTGAQVREDMATPQMLKSTEGLQQALRDLLGPEASGDVACEGQSNDFETNGCFLPATPVHTGKYPQQECRAEPGTRSAHKEGADAGLADDEHIFALQTEIDVARADAQSAREELAALQDALESSREDCMQTEADLEAALQAARTYKDAAAKAEQGLEVAAHDAKERGEAHIRLVEKLKQDLALAEARSDVEHARRGHSDGDAAVGTPLLSPGGADGSLIADLADLQGQLKQQQSAREWQERDRANECAALRGARNELHDECEQLRQAAQDMQVEHTTALADKESVLAEAQQEVQSMRQKVWAMQAQVEEAQRVTACAQNAAQQLEDLAEAQAKAAGRAQERLAASEAALVEAQEQAVTSAKPARVADEQLEAGRAAEATEAKVAEAEDQALLVEVDSWQASLVAAQAAAEELCRLLVSNEASQDGQLQRSLLHVAELEVREDAGGERLAALRKQVAVLGAALAGVAAKSERARTSHNTLTTGARHELASAQARAKEVAAAVQASHVGEVTMQEKALAAALADLDRAQAQHEGEVKELRLQLRAAVLGTELAQAHHEGAMDELRQELATRQAALDEARLALSVATDLSEEHTASVGVLTEKLAAAQAAACSSAVSLAEERKQSSGMAQDLKAALERAGKADKEASEEAATASVQLREKEDELEATREEVLRLQRQVAGANAATDDARKSLDDAAMESARHLCSFERQAGALVAAESRQTELGSAVRELSAALVAARAETAKERAECEAACARAADLEGELQTARVQVATDHVQLENKQQHLEMVLQALQEASDAQASTASQAEVLRSEVERLEAALAERAAEVDALQRRLQEAEVEQNAEVGALHVQLQAASAGASALASRDDEVQRLRAELEAHRGAAGVAEATEHRLRAAAQGGEAEVSSLREALAEQEAKALLHVAALEVRGPDVLGFVCRVIFQVSVPLSCCHAVMFSCCNHFVLEWFIMLEPTSEQCGGLPSTPLNGLKWYLVTVLVRGCASIATRICASVQAAAESERDHSEECRLAAEARMVSLAAQVAEVAQANATLRVQLAESLDREANSTAAAQLEQYSKELKQTQDERDGATTKAAQLLQEVVATRAREETAVAREGQVAEALEDTQARLTSAVACTEQLGEELRLSRAQMESLESELATCHLRMDSLDRALAAAKAASCCALAQAEEQAAAARWDAQQARSGAGGAEMAERERSAVLVRSADT
jgi:chromosome segregation ATPase